MREVVVRVAGAGEVAGILEMERTATMAPHWAESVYAGMLGERVGGAEEAGRRHRVLVAVSDGGELLGFGVAGLVGTTRYAEVENLVVREAARRRGIGRAICEGLVAWARAGGAAEMELEVRAGNVGARALYELLGFAAVGVRRGYYGGSEDAVLMRLLLAAGDRR